MTYRIAALALALFLPAAGWAAGAPPSARIAPVVDDYFGTKVTDDYRWMEDRKGAEFIAWVKGQSAYARSTLDRIPGREALQARIAAHTAGGAAVGGLKLAGGRVFSLVRRAGENSFKLYVRDGVGGRDRLLLDPDRIPTTGAHYAIDYFAPSMDGASLAYGVSPGGSEDSVIHILDVATGKESSETIDRCESGSPQWLPGGKAFAYNRQTKVAPGAPETEKYLNSRVLIHVVGADPSQDTPVLGTGVEGSPVLTPVDNPFMAITAGSPYVVAIIDHGAVPALTMYLALATDLAAGRPRWRLLADVGDAVTDVAVHGDQVFLLSHKGAPRYQVLETSATAPDAVTAKVVVPASARVVQAIGDSADGLYVRDLDGGLSRLRKLDFASGKLADVPLPIDGALSGPLLDPASPQVLVGLQGWVTAPAVYAGTGGGFTKLDIVPPWADDLTPYVAEEVTATAADGVRIPVSIVHRRGLALDGSHPVWLTGYGAYGISLQPALVSRFLALLDDGGVYAVAHVRGGGEFGEDWHLAGKQATKPNTYLDLIAAAEYLVASGYGKPSTLAIEGRSAGGITVGMALTARPDLFRVVFSGVGDSNTLRTENATDGAANALEYGSVVTEAGFKALYAVDSTQHVKPGVAYPAVLLTTGMNDPRVAPWQPGKMTAHLQAATSSGRPVLLLADFDAGHGMGSTKAQKDKEMADQMAFFYWQIGKAAYQPAP